MEFYQDIVHRLYISNTKIANTNFSDPLEFIEAKHMEATYKGKVFYENILHELPNHFGAKMFPNIFKNIAEYCKSKITESINRGNIIPTLESEYLMHMEFAQKIKTLPQKDQQAYYKSILESYIDQKNSLLLVNRKLFDKSKDDFYDAAIKGLKMKLDQINEEIRKEGGDILRIIDPDELRTKYEKWTDDEFRNACENLDKLNLLEKISFIYSHTRWVGLFGVIEREINQKKYHYGIVVENYSTAQTIGYYFINEEKIKSFNYLIDDIYNRLSKCTDQDEKSALINDEINLIERRLDVGKEKSEVLYMQENPFAYGYLTEKRKLNWHLTQVLSPYNFSDITQTRFNLVYCISVAYGAAAYLFQKKMEKIKKELFALENGTLLPDAENSYEITIADRILRELDIIEHIYKSQLNKFEQSNSMPYPLVLDKNGKEAKRVQYINIIDIYSDTELFNIQRYKREFTERFENAAKLNLLKNQFTEILTKAQKIKSIYNDNLTNKSNIVKEYFRKSELPLKERLIFTQQHSAVVTIRNFYICEIYLGTDRSSIGTIINTSDNYHFTFISNNNELATFCQHMIEFIIKFDIIPVAKINNGKIKEPSEAKSLKDIFIDSKTFESSIKALKEINAIDARSKNLIGNKFKGVIQVWVHLLKESPKMIIDISDEKLTVLLNMYFKNLNISEKSNGKHLRNVNNNAKNIYRKKLLAIMR